MVLFASELTDYYAWAVPKGESVLVGSAFEQSDGAKERFDRIVAWYRGQLGLGAEIAQRTARRLTRPRARAQLLAGGGRVLLVGEAAGLVSPSSGEGISRALSSGAAAGRAAAATSPFEAYDQYFTPAARRLHGEDHEGEDHLHPQAARHRAAAALVPVGGRQGPRPHGTSAGAAPVGLAPALEGGLI